MQDKTMKTLTWVVVAILLVGGGYFIYKQSAKPGTLDEFAQCLADKEAKFYGAFWCPHCQNQKAMFGKSQKLLPYIECSTPDGEGQLQVCIDKEVTGYPTWEFADGTRLGGEVQLKTLSEKTTCPLPGENLNLTPDSEESTDETATSTEASMVEENMEQ